MATPEKPHPFDTMLSFGKFVPGFDFLQGLMNNADKSLPSIGQWVAPTLDPQELDKRINDLKAVHFWLEQNSRMLAATIQALEVQRMTLSTLQTMNVNMADLREAMKVSAVPAEKAAAAAPAPPAAAAGPAEPAPQSAKGKGKSKGEEPTVAKPAVDAMEWWGALTKQFSHLAHNAVNESFKGVPGAAPSAGATPKSARKRAAGKSAPSAPKRTSKPARSPRRST